MEAPQILHVNIKDLRIACFLASIIKPHVYCSKTNTSHSHFLSGWQTHLEESSSTDLSYFSLPFSYAPSPINDGGALSWSIIIAAAGLFIYIKLK